MTEGAFSACVGPGSDVVAFPAVLVNHDLAAERLIRNPIRPVMMAVAACDRSLFRITIVMMTNAAFDPEIIEVLFVRHVQGRRVDLVMTFLTFDPEIVYVLEVRKDDLAGR